MYLLSAGLHTRVNCPVSFTTASCAIDEGAPYVRFESGYQLPAQVSVCGENAVVTFILDYMIKGEQARFELLFDKAAKPCGVCAELTDKTVEFTAGGQFITRYYFGKDLAKPYMGPFYEKFGSQLTRLNFEIREHPHHRSLWVSHGDVNGVDNWNERPEHGFIVNQAIENLVCGGVFAGFTARNLWTTHGGEPICDEVTTYKVYATPAHMRIVDVTITLEAKYKQVTLGNTKEAGPIAVRLQDALTVKNTGTFETPTGVNEGEIWMKRAAWCDYHGVSDGHAGGVAIFDNPENENFPTYWHARNYGLMAPNNSFLLGPRVIEQGDSITWNFRVVVHNGDTRDADIPCRYMDYAAMPAVTVDEADA